MGFSSTQYTVGVSVLVCCAGIYSLVNRRKNDEVSETITTLIRKRRSVFPKQYCDESVDKRVLEAMLEAGRWAPTHKITEPWNFHVFETEESRLELGQFLAKQYQETCEKAGKTFSQAKHDKKISNALKSSFVVALICETGKGKNPVVEEIASVAMNVQNMLLVAAAHDVGEFNMLDYFVSLFLVHWDLKKFFVAGLFPTDYRYTGAYWSSGSVYDSGKEVHSTLIVNNPQPTRDFLSLEDSQICLGWMFVGSCDVEKWPKGRRSELIEGKQLVWK